MFVTWKVVHRNVLNCFIFIQTFWLITIMHFQLKWWGLGLDWLLVLSCERFSDMASNCRMESAMLLLIFILVSFDSCQSTSYNTDASQDVNYLKSYLDKRLDSFRVDIHRSFQKQHRRNRREVDDETGKQWNLVQWRTIVDSVLFTTADL